MLLFARCSCPPQLSCLCCTLFILKRRRHCHQYDLLGLTSGATPRDVQRAYYTLSARIHPDKNPNNPKAKVAMQLLNDARQELRARLEAEELEMHNAAANVANMMRQPVF